MRKSDEKLERQTCANLKMNLYLVYENVISEPRRKCAGDFLT